MFNKVSFISALSILLLAGCQPSNSSTTQSSNKSLTVEQAQQAVINPTGVDQNIVGDQYAHYDDDSQINNDSDDKIEAIPPMSVTDNDDNDPGEIILMDDDDSEIDDDEADQE